MEYTQIVTLKAKEGYSFKKVVGGMSASKNFFTVTGVPVANVTYDSIPAVPSNDKDQAEPNIVRSVDVTIKYAKLGSARTVTGPIYGVTIPVVGLKPALGTTIDDFANDQFKLSGSVSYAEVAAPGTWTSAVGDVLTADQLAAFLNSNGGNPVFNLNSSYFFDVDTYYAAKFTLVAKPGWTFQGLAANKLGVSGVSLSARHVAVPLAKNPDTLDVIVIFDKTKPVGPVYEIVAGTVNGISGIPAPVAGDKPRTSVGGLTPIGGIVGATIQPQELVANADLVWEVSEDANDISNHPWTTLGRFDEAGQFIEGMYYSVMITLSAKASGDGYYFDPTWTDVSPEVSGYPPAGTGEVADSLADFVNRGNSVSFRIVYPVTPGVSNNGGAAISTGNLGNIFEASGSGSAPSAGVVAKGSLTNPTFTGVTGDKVLTESLDWFEKNDAGAWIPANLTADNRFKSGVEYSTLVSLRLASDYEFDSSLTQGSTSSITVTNAGSATVKVVSAPTTPYKEITLRLEFPKTP